MKPRFYLQADDGRFATYDMLKGPSLTAIKALSYSWNSESEAQAQLPLYAATLRVALRVVSNLSLN